MDIEHESVVVADDDRRVVVVRYERIVSGHGTRVDMGGRLVIDRANAAWLADELDAFAEDSYRRQVDVTLGADQLTVYGSGHEMAPYVNVLNERSAEPVGLSGFVLTWRYARRLAALLRGDGSGRALAGSAREWAARLAHVAGTDRAELSRALGGAFYFPPDGVTHVDLDDRPVGVGGVDVRFADGAVRRPDVEEVFGAGTPLPRAGGDDPLHEVHLVDVPGAPYRCSVIVEYGVDHGDDVVRGVKLRVDSTRQRR